MKDERNKANGRLFLAVIAGISTALVLALGVTMAGSSDASVPPTKQSIEKNLQAVRDRAMQYPAPPKHPGGDPSLVFPTPGPEVPTVSLIPSGSGFIVDAQYGPPGDREGVWLNGWYEETASNVIDVYAGGLATDPMQGVLVVAVWGSDRADWVKGGRFLTPDRDGAVQVISSEGDLLTLKAEDGTRFRFNIGTLGFE